MEIKKKIKEQERIFKEYIKGARYDPDITSIIEWLEKKQRDYKVKLSEVGLEELKSWVFDPKTGTVSHETGRFFSVIGVKIEGAKDREVSSWAQPMIKQKECGILGILCQEKKGLRHYLLQAKFEPGNTNKLQLSPTLQATESNLKQYHKGKKPLFSEYFEDSLNGKVIRETISVEDGGRFYLKTNRNMIIEINKKEQLNIPDNFIWLNLFQLKELINRDLYVNALVRSVIAGL
ncbi:response regulator receiver protein [Candidatus Pacearchaeota archaeon]|nr:response regulator receiver protein [Candidatus Pacearchaeota archaeon]